MQVKVGTMQKIVDFIWTRAATGWLTYSAGINSMSVTIRLGPTVIGLRRRREGLSTWDKNSIAWHVGPLKPD